MITSLGEERELVYVFLVHLFILHALILSFFSFSWCRGLSAACDCGTPFLLTFFGVFGNGVSRHVPLSKVKVEIPIKYSLGAANVIPQCIF